MDAYGKIAILKSNRGITLIIIALLIVVLVAFVGLAVDIGYMYVAKGQLQNAADSSSLAGVVLLTGENDLSSNAYHQEAARREAWKFACKNFAAGANVYVQTNAVTDCNSTSPPSYSDLNGSTNAASGDIIVGHWDSSARTFTIATGSTGLSINAMQITARRTAGSPGGQVGIFFGKVLGWSMMSASAIAIANEFARTAPLPLCVGICSTTTPLPGGTKFFFETNKGTPNIGWTSLNLSENTPQPTVVSILNQGGNQYDICGQCIFTTQGTLGGGISSPINVFDSLRATNSKTHSVNGFSVTGWKILFPILNNTPSGCGGNTTFNPGCFWNLDPGVQAHQAHYQVNKFVEAIVISVDGPPDFGITLVGTGPPDGASTSTFVCADCSTPFPGYTKAILVK